MLAKCVGGWALPSPSTEVDARSFLGLVGEYVGPGFQPLQ